MLPVVWFVCFEQVHHKCFIFNFGHLFMWWDMILGTYKSPLSVDAFSKDI